MPDASQSRGARVAAPARWSKSIERRRFIVRHGVLRWGLLLGLVVFAWAVRGEFAGPLEHLRTPAGWLRLAFLLVLCVAEWMVGAGWLIGQGLWYLRTHPMKPAGGRDTAAAPPRHGGVRGR